MKYEERRGDLFSLPENEYYFAQCISADFAMGAGIAVRFNREYAIKQGLTQKFGDFLKYWDDPYGRGRGWCLYYNHVFNLITKRNYWEKPSEDTMYKALLCMHNLCIKHSVLKLVMPKIGCGLDKMQWESVQDMIHGIFNDTDIEIVVMCL